jgi:hypothetical protein
MVKQALNLQVNVRDLKEQQKNIFHTRCHISMIIDSRCRS